MKSRPKGLGWIIVLLCIAFVATLAYWIVFFTSGDVQVRTDDMYIAFEKAFPPADAWMALCALSWRNWFVAPPVVGLPVCPAGSLQLDIFGINGPDV